MPRSTSCSTPSTRPTSRPRPRGRRRDDVRLLVQRRRRRAGRTPASPTSATFLAAGDLVVVNTSATVPGRGRRPPARRRSRRRALLERAARRCVAGRGAPAGATAPRRPASSTLAGASVDLARRRPRAAATPASPDSQRLWLATRRPRHGASLLDYLDAHGRPIRYRHVPRDVAARARTRPCSHASRAARRCRARPAVHPRARHRPRRPRRRASRRSCCTPACRRSKATSARTPSATACPRDTAATSTRCTRDGGRVIAVGTTVVRALGTVTDDRGVVHPGAGLDRGRRHPRHAGARRSTACSPAGTSPRRRTC